MKMMSKAMILAMVEECYAEKKKTQRVPHYYKRNGVMVERSCPDYVYTARYEELFYDSEEKTLRSPQARIFKCECCGKMVGYWNLEAWMCDFEEDEYICSHCYEDGMGEDL